MMPIWIYGITFLLHTSIPHCCMFLKIAVTSITRRMISEYPCGGNSSLPIMSCRRWRLFDDHPCIRISGWLR
ncbi:uncharacterized protein BT62DRAFT_216535 [Guyanagaster necrorhizus]|uniref:Uncharacterized protein n=1 Tax=Guyanagaster necrorhizus TaxID=856835 RepID=A0A9P8AQZ1_9AGAR|nr:uncharacterized protein BT62DRAFT_216535 [Guyanagaster necrorhizus MCA 3950]KAG7444619.1 hypothetical protein BT62DRAFT_216535 [Guyanagaster necrorhizus MCA 3950]